MRALQSMHTHRCFFLFLSHPKSLQLCEWMSSAETAPGFSPTSSKYLCERQFNPDDFVSFVQGAKSLGHFRKRLRPNAVPRCEWQIEAPTLEPLATTVDDPPVLHRFDEDSTLDEMRIQEATTKKIEKTNMKTNERRLRRKLSQHLVSRAKTNAVAKRKFRKFRSFEMKLEAAKQALNRSRVVRQPEFVKKATSSPFDGERATDSTTAITRRNWRLQR